MKRGGCGRGLRRSGRVNFGRWFRPPTSPPRKPAAAEGGSALVETIFVIAAILIPMVWIALAVTRVEAASYAVRAAAREAARTYVTASSSASGAARAQVAARLAFEDQRAPVGTAQISCSATPCLSPGASVHARAVTRVDLPFVPHWLASGTGLQIRVDAQHTETVERYGGTR